MANVELQQLRVLTNHPTGAPFLAGKLAMSGQTENLRWKFSIAEDASVKSAARVFKVLQIFSRLRMPLKHCEIARHIGMPASSASMLLWSMVRLGYLTFNSSERKFFPTQLVARIGGWIQGAPAESRVTRAVRKLARETGKMVITGAQCGNYVRYLDVIPAAGPVGLYVEPGVTRPLPGVNLGLALLSAKADKQIERIVRALNADRPAGWDLFKLRDVMELIDRIRSQGYVHMPSLVVPGASVIATVVCTDPVMVVGVAGLTGSDTDTDKLIEAVRNVAVEALGPVTTLAPARL